MTEEELKASEPIRGIVSMIRVTDIAKSAEFYRHLGFEIGNAVPRVGPPFNWVWLYQPQAPNWKTSANLMLVANDIPGAVENPARTVLFYLYATNMRSLRQDLLEKGFKVSEISYPPYLPDGEFRLEDPDHYTLMIAQTSQDTP